MHSDGPRGRPEAPAGVKTSLKKLRVRLWESVSGHPLLLPAPCFAVFLQLCGGGGGDGRLSLILLDQMSLEVVQVRLSSVCPGVKEGEGEKHRCLSQEC